MSHWWCCCAACPYGGPPDCLDRTTGTVTWFTHTVNDDNTITRVDHSGPCYTCYVDSVSGDVDETGNGTEARPFVNLNSIFSGSITKSGTGTLASGVFTPGSAPSAWAAGRLIGAKLVLDGTNYEVTANTTTTATIADPPDDDTYSWTLYIFDSTCIYNICTHGDPPDNCPKVKVLVKGTIDYTVVGNSGRNYLRNLVIEPWDEETITIDVCNSSGVTLCVGCVFKHINVTTTGTGMSGYSHAYGFKSCHSSTFDTCNGVATSAGGIGYGFYYCYSSVLDTCSGSGSGVVTGGYGGWYGSGHGFRHCYSSTLKNCAGVGTVTGTDVGGSYGKGYTYCHSSVFDTCVGSGTGKGTTAYGANAGYYHCNYSVFKDCTGTGTTVADGNGEAIGFLYNTFSVFDTCTGTGNAREIGCRIACGFNSNNCSSFYTCTTSDRVCEDCPGIPYFSCDDWVCDDLDTQLLEYEETIEGVLTLEPEHTVLDIRETIEGVLKLEPEHSILDIRETLEGVLTLEVTHSIV